MNNTQDYYAVMGNPIAHSRSPEIHQLFAEMTNQHIIYEKILVAIDEFPKALKRFIDKGGKGLNITLPFKQQAFQCVDQLNAGAQAACAVNTIIIQPDCTTIGDNTDGIGLVNDLQHHCGIDLNNKHILLIGASGAARGVILPLLNTHPASLHIANRTLEKAEQLVKHFANASLSASDLNDIPLQHYDLIINATSSSVNQQLPEVSKKLIHNKVICYDMFYQKGQTIFQRWALEQGAKAAYDGFGMLVEQAAQSFYLWRGVLPKLTGAIEPMRNTI